MVNLMPPGGGSPASGRWGQALGDRHDEPTGSVPGVPALSHALSPCSLAKIGCNTPMVVRTPQRVTAALCAAWRAISPVTHGISRVLVEGACRCSACMIRTESADSQADSAGSIPVIRSNVKAQVGECFRTLGLQSFWDPTGRWAISGPLGPRMQDPRGYGGWPSVGPPRGWTRCPRFPGVLLLRWPLRACCYRRGSTAAARSRATDPATTRAEPAAILGLRRCTARGTRRT